MVGTSLASQGLSLDCHLLPLHAERSSFSSFFFFFVFFVFFFVFNWLFPSNLVSANSILDVFCHFYLLFYVWDFCLLVEVFFSSFLTNITISWNIEEGSTWTVHAAVLVKHLEVISKQ